MLRKLKLGLALAHFGRIFKTLHVLSYVDAEPYRRGIKRMRNLQEQRHVLAKYVFHGRKGELHKAYHGSRGPPSPGRPDRSAGHRRRRPCRPGFEPSAAIAAASCSTEAGVSSGTC